MKTFKKIAIILGIGIAAAISWYLLSPLWRVVELDETSPLEGNSQAIGDQFDMMDETKKAEFQRQVDLVKNEIKEMEDTMPEQVRVIAEAQFKPRAHDVSGKAVLIEQEGAHILRFEDFETINGPDVRIYLASDLSDQDIIDLGPIRATRGNVNYPLPDSVDLNHYTKVLVWCRAFSVLFSYAEL